MITRRNLFKGLFATIGALLLRSFGKAEQSIEGIGPKIALAEPKTKLYYPYLDIDGQVKGLPNGGRKWFEDRCINNWVHGSNSIDDVHFEASDEAIEFYNNLFDRTKWKQIGETNDKQV